MATPLNDGLWKLRKAAQCDADMQAVQEHVLKLESENRGLRQDLADRTAQARRQQVTIDEMTARLARHVDERPEYTITTGGKGTADSPAFVEIVPAPLVLVDASDGV